MDRAEKNLQMVLAVIDRSVEGVGDQELAGIPQMERLRKRLFEDAITSYEKLRSDNPADRCFAFCHGTLLHSTGNNYVRIFKG